VDRCANLVQGAVHTDPALSMLNILFGAKEFPSMNELQVMDALGSPKQSGVCAQENKVTSTPASRSCSAEG
jgi:hypothetical protein